RLRRLRHADAEHRGRAGGPAHLPVPFEHQVRVPRHSQEGGLMLPGVAPAVAGSGDPYWASVVLLLHMDGADGSTMFIDSSANGLTVTANGNAQIDTAQSKFGGAAALFDGNGDYLALPSTGAL